MFVPLHAEVPGSPSFLPANFTHSAFNLTSSAGVDTSSQLSPDDTRFRADPSDNLAVKYAISTGTSVRCREPSVGVTLRSRDRKTYNLLSLRRRKTGAERCKLTERPMSIAVSPCRRKSGILVLNRAGARARRDGSGRLEALPKTLLLTRAVTRVLIYTPWCQLLPRAALCCASAIRFVGISQRPAREISTDSATRIGMTGSAICPGGSDPSISGCISPLA